MLVPGVAVLVCDSAVPLVCVLSAASLVALPFGIEAASCDLKPKVPDTYRDRETRVTYQCVTERK